MFTRHRLTLPFEQTTNQAVDIGHQNKWNERTKDDFVGSIHSKKSEMDPTTDVQAKLNVFSYRNRGRTSWGIKS